LRLNDEKNPRFFRTVKNFQANSKRHDFLGTTYAE
jgi:hypothetical protein